MYTIRKVGVIGSGTMGGGIATLLAGVGIPVVLLDIPAKDTAAGDPAEKRNAIVLDNLNKLKKSRIPAIFSSTDLDLITIGNTEDDLGKLAQCDWIIEVIIEKLAAKQDLMAKLEHVRQPQAIVSTNTSGLSVNTIAEGRSAEFKRHFLGTHFFNPPRHLKLLEIIPTTATDPELVKFMRHFAEDVLGKGVVVCKDTPNFIANRFISIAGGFGMNYAYDHDYTVEEVDLLTGPLIGRPKSGTFRLADVVGIDVLAYVAQNLYPAIADDPHREILRHAGTAKVTQFLMDNKFLGDKTGQGFFKKVEKDGQREFWALNLKTLEYDPPQKVKFESVDKHRKISNTGARIKALINESDRAAQYLWHLHAFYLSYAALMLGDIADDIQAIDNANKWGFNHELGAFEIWDAIGVRESVARMQGDGYNVPSWVHDMLAAGIETFYRRDASGAVTGVYNRTRKAYDDVMPDKNVILLHQLKAAGKEVDRNGGASLIDLGDGVGLVEFHTKANALDFDIFAMLDKTLDRMENGEFEALVVGNQGDYFSAGANLFVMAMAAQNGQMDEIEKMIRTGQDLMQRMRYFHKPIVTAPFGVTVGGGCEMTMTGARVVAHSELYIGLVEFGVGLIPAWCGTKEMVRRVVTPPMLVPNADPLPGLQKAFEQIALAKVTGSAMEAREAGFLRPIDTIVMDRDRQIAQAKRVALELVESGYTPMPRQKIYAAGRDAKAALLMGIYQLQEGRYASEHDAKLARGLAHIMCGGNITAPSWVDEQHFLDLELEVFLSLVSTPKTLERIQHMLMTNKPLRN
ncbi:MAG: 3-hydroxyacyl-CoA dehydrogenase/enoyl-CoA hydratase family protein [Anaerolineae bacterium]